MRPYYHVCHTCIFYIVHTTYSHYGSTRTADARLRLWDKEGVYNWCTCIGVHTTKPSKHQTWPCFLSTLLSFSAVRACGGWVAWGRNITKGNSAVRIRYIPTDLAAIVTQPERSQVQKLGVTVSNPATTIQYNIQAYLRVWRKPCTVVHIFPRTMWYFTVALLPDQWANLLLGDNDSPWWWFGRLQYSSPSRQQNKARCKPPS